MLYPALQNRSTVACCRFPFGIASRRERASMEKSKKITPAPWQAISPAILHYEFGESNLAYIRTSEAAQESRSRDTPYNRGMSIAFRQRLRLLGVLLILAGTLATACGSPRR